MHALVCLNTHTHTHREREIEKERDNFSMENTFDYLSLLQMYLMQLLASSLSFKIYYQSQHNKHSLDILDNFTSFSYVSENQSARDCFFLKMALS